VKIKTKARNFAFAGIGGPSEMLHEKDSQRHKRGA
jgi:hypothetical protein